MFAPDNTKHTAKTTIFESDKIRKAKVTKDDDGKITDAGKAENVKHTLTVEFDFAKVTDAEIASFLTSTTSVMKMFQNNVTKHWEEKTILETCAKGIYKQSVRDLLDNRTTRILTDEERRRRFIQNERKQGKTKEQIKKELESMLAEME